VAEHLLSKCKALNSNHSTTKKKEIKGGGEHRRPYDPRRLNPGPANTQTQLLPANSPTAQMWEQPSVPQGMTDKQSWCLLLCVPHSRTWMSMGTPCWVKEARHRRTDTVRSCLHEMSRRLKSMGTESSLGLPGLGAGRAERWRPCPAMGFSLGCFKKFLSSPR
jgi:hypothetical protein